MSRCACAVWAALLAPAALAQTAALPYYTPAQAMQGLYRAHQVPLAQAWAERAERLAPAVQARCDAPGGDAGALADARTAWADATVAWERLSAVVLGPLIERRSVRAIDFTPTRPQAIERAIESAPSDAAAMERIGTPAKGLPALEWLLWTTPVAPGSPACRYALQVALDIEREAAALRREIDARAAAAWDAESAGTAFEELLNQWVGGLERLRWQHLERPLEAAGSRSAPDFPRAASGQTAASWAAQWQTLRALALAGDAAPVPGVGVVPLETYLRGRGLTAQADALRQAVLRADRALQGLEPGATARLRGAAEALGALKQRVEAEVAPALELSIGFSDADGD